jgi:hypothetical protein
LAEIAYEELINDSVIPTMGRVEYGLPSSLAFSLSSTGLAAQLSSEILWLLSDFATVPKYEPPVIIERSDSMSRSSSIVSIDSLGSTSSSVTVSPITLPKVTDMIDFRAQIDVMTLHFSEDHTSKEARTFLFQCAAQVKLTKRDEQQAVGIEVNDLQMHSFQLSDPSKARVQVILSPKISFNVRKTMQGDTTIMLDCQGFDVRVSFRDIKAAIRLAENWDSRQRTSSAEEATLQSWTQAVRPIEPYSPPDRRTLITGREDLIAYLGNLNIMLINNVDDNTNPVVLLSSNVEGSVRNWSSSLEMDITLAVCIFHSFQVFDPCRWPLLRCILSKLFGSRFWLECQAITTSLPPTFRGL